MKTYFFSFLLLLFGLFTSLDMQASVMTDEGGVVILVDDKNGNGTLFIGLQNLYFENTSSAVSIKLINSKGKTVIFSKLTEPYLVLPKLPTGIYTVLIEAGDFTIKESIVLL